MKTITKSSIFHFCVLTFALAGCSRLEDLPVVAANQTWRVQLRETCLMDHKTGPSDPVPNAPLSLGYFKTKEKQNPHFYYGIALRFETLNTEWNKIWPAPVFQSVDTGEKFRIQRINYFMEPIDDKQFSMDLPPQVVFPVREILSVGRQTGTINNIVFVISMRDNRPNQKVTISGLFDLAPFTIQMKE